MRFVTRPPWVVSALRLFAEDRELSHVGLLQIIRSASGKGRQFRSIVKAIQNLRHSCPAYAEEAGERCPALELAGIQKRLVITGQSKRVAAGVTRVVALRLDCGWSVPGGEFDDWLST